LILLFNGQDRYAKRHAGALKSNDKEAGLRALIRELTQLSLILG
jgi:hypothetical protein